MRSTYKALPVAHIQKDEQKLHFMYTELNLKNYALLQSKFNRFPEHKETRLWLCKDSEQQEVSFSLRNSFETMCKSKLFSHIENMSGREIFFC